jgi:hypothetical protein
MSLINTLLASASQNEPVIVRVLTLEAITYNVANNIYKYQLKMNVIASFFATTTL